MQTITKHSSYTFEVPDYGSHLDIDTLQDIVKRSGSHFFDRETMKWFRSKVDAYTYSAPDGWYFVTSEKHESAFAGINEARAYTVRRMSVGTLDNGSQDIQLYELEGFQHYATLNRARTAARLAAKEARALCSQCRLRLSADSSRTVCAECTERQERRADVKA
jgi:hypothetical protein